MASLVSTIALACTGFKLFEKNGETPRQIFLIWYFMCGMLFGQWLVIVLNFYPHETKADFELLATAVFIWVFFGGLTLFMIAFQFFAGSKLILQKLSLDDDRDLNRTYSKLFFYLVVFFAVFCTATCIGVVAHIATMEPFNMNNAYVTVSILHVECILTDTISTILLFMAWYTIRRGIKQNHTLLNENVVEVRKYLFIFGFWEITNIMQFVDEFILFFQGYLVTDQPQYYAFNALKYIGLATA